MRVFFSYASEDRDVASAIADALRGEGHDVYPSANWPKNLGAALKRAEAFVVLLSPAAVGSPFVGEEIKLALVAERLEDRVIPVVLNPSTKVPWILQTMEPIAAKPNAKTAAELINKRLQGHGAAGLGAR